MKTKLVIIALMLLALATLAFAQYNPEVGIQDRVWLLKGDRRIVLGDEYRVPAGSPDHSVVAVVIIPENVRSEIVSAAWSYAVRYSADGVDLPNYQAAVELMMQRHPTWIAAATKGYTISFNADRAELDLNPTFEASLPLIAATEEPMILVTEETNP